MHKSKSLFNCSGAGTGEPCALKDASTGVRREARHDILLQAGGTREDIPGLSGILDGET